MSKAGNKEERERKQLFMRESSIPFDSARLAVGFSPFSGGESIPYGTPRGAFGGGDLKSSTGCRTVRGSLLQSMYRRRGLLGEYRGRARRLHGR